MPASAGAQIVARQGDTTCSSTPKNDALLLEGRSPGSWIIRFTTPSRCDPVAIVVSVPSYSGGGRAGLGERVTLSSHPTTPPASRFTSAAERTAQAPSRIFYKKNELND